MALPPLLPSLLRLPPCARTLSAQYSPPPPLSLRPSLSLSALRFRLDLLAAYPNFNAFGCNADKDKAGRANEERAKEGRE
eukprot:3933351-Rhodomonas_salina.2